MLKALWQQPNQQQQPNQLCDHCHQKPKHGGHPYCSRSCAKDATTPGAPSKMCSQCNQRPKFQGFEYCGKTCAQAARGAKPSQGGNQQQKKPANPTRTATPPKNPALPTVNPSMPAQFPTVHPQLQPAVPTKCRTDDCWEMSETDALGNKISDYCSEEHAEDAVLSGAADPCVMCLKLPQSDNDYFCSRACKDKSMQKDYNQF